MFQTDASYCQVRNDISIEDHKLTTLPLAVDSVLLGYNYVSEFIDDIIHDFFWNEFVDDFFESLLSKEVDNYLTSRNDSYVGSVSPHSCLVSSCVHLPSPPLCHNAGNLQMVCAVASLSNLGNTCYSNSILQMRRAVPLLWRDIRVDGCSTWLGNEFIDVMHFLANNTGILSPVGYCYALQEYLGYDVFTQYDAAQVLLSLLQAPFFNAVNFEVCLNRNTKCFVCLTLTSTRERQVIWQLCPLSSIENALKEFFQPSKLYGDNRYMCGQCQRNVDAETFYTIVSLPSVLFFQLKRFGMTHNCLVKTSDMVKPNYEMMVGPSRYKLYAAISHMGDLEDGHYIAHIDVQGCWWRCSDANISRSSWDSICSEDVYILAYCRC